jgi:hypothetical protein
MKYLYLLSPLVFVNYFCIPASAIVVIYIAKRNDKKRFTYAFLFLFVFLLGYIIAIFKFETIIGINKFYGYITYFNRYSIINYTFFVVISLIIAYCIIKYDKFKDKDGLYIIMGSSLITLIEVGLFMLNIKIFPHLILTDLCWILSLNYSLGKFKR